MALSNPPLTMDDRIFENIVSLLLNQPIRSVTKIGRGRNSRVVKVHCENDDIYAAKAYFGKRADGMSRLSVELQSLEMLWQRGLRCIPQPLAADASNHVAVYEYVSGQEIHTEDVGEGDIDELLSFLCKLKSLARASHGLDVPMAHEACFSVRDIIKNIRLKLDHVTALQDDGPCSAELQTFLRQDFIPVFHHCTEQAKESLGSMFFTTELPPKFRTLSPADFGFHNILRRPNGDLVFFDFEYFGWEEPAKMISDFLLHPAMSLQPKTRHYFAQRFFQCFSEDRNLEARFRIVYPLFGLRWCMILLNEFIPQDLERRRFASTSLNDIPSMCKAQLAKSREMLQRSIRGYEGLS
jgi:hypothetical protein